MYIYILSWYTTIPKNYAIFVIVVHGSAIFVDHPLCGDVKELIKCNSKIKYCNRLYLYLFNYNYI